MSDHDKLATYHFSLPVETWSEIFEYAIYVPNLVDTDDTDVRGAFVYPNSATPVVPSSLVGLCDPLQPTLNTRSSLALVCKAWHAITTPLLYRLLRIRSYQEMHALAKTFQSSRKQSRSLHLGTFVRHLRIESSVAFGAITALDPLFSCLTRLKILTLNLPYTTMHSRLLLGPLSHCKQTLRRLAISNLRDGILSGGRDGHSLVTVLNSLPHLRSMTICSEAGMMACPCLLPRLPELTFLGAFDCLCHYHHRDTPTFPSLRHLDIQLPVIRRGCITHLLKLQGHLLTSVFMNTFPICRFNTGPLHAACNLLKDHCPKLATLAIMVGPFEAYQHLMLDNFPAVTHFGLLSPRFERNEPERFYPWLAAMGAIPSIRVLRLMDRWISGSVHTAIGSGEESVRTHLKECHYRLEDYDGDTISF
ncbi:hypothetical protein EVG20_g5634 [Dentipellis fragilis]|uniref:Uncharacterized protein n=1 Tax=Dentipellis fragilis TaxID=205917 RepID=A0A4Y9YUD0_9AGAM|nr:hypothetical protein EVG20_g5634 [Dentipellis fragilis]